MKSFVVIGLGRFGTQIAKKLYEMDQEVLVLDINQEKVQQIADSVTQAVTGDAQDKEVLYALGVRNCDCAIVAIGSNMESSVTATMNLKELEVPYIICKAHNYTHKRILEKLGADRVVIPEQEMADRLARKLVEPDILDYIEISDSIKLVEQQAPASWFNKSIRDLSIRAKMGINVIAVKNGIDITVAPGADYVIREGDIIVIIGNQDALDKLQKK